ncbi:MAG: 50S ribosomal protein L10 [Bacillota bacterium]
MAKEIINQKAELVAGIKEKIEKSRAVIFVDYKGITVDADTAIRKSFREAGLEYKVLKNTMVRRAFNEIGVTAFDETLNGPTAIAFGYEDEAQTAKAIADVAAANKNFFNVKAAYVDGQSLDEDKIKMLATLGSRAGVYAQLMGTLLAPMQKLAGTLQAVAEKEA